MRTIFTLALLSLAPNALAGGGAKQSVCHADGAGGYILINVSTSAVDAHLANHGDVLAGAYFPDADGDGFGSADGAVKACPEPGYTLDGSDCDDNDSSVHPDAAEVCGDEFDNDCDLNIDEDCEVQCPCTQIPIWNDVLTNGVPVEYCEEYGDYAAASYFWADNSGYGIIIGVNYSPEGFYYGECVVSNFNDEQHYIGTTAEEGQACANQVAAWLDANGAVCNQF